MREGLEVSIAQTLTVDIELQLSSVAETITITGQSPMVDVKSTTIDITYSEEALQKVPSARDVWSILEHQTPAVITNRNDVGGSEQGLQAIFSARGSSWQENTYKLNGVTVTDPSAIGASGFYFDYDSFEEVQVSSGSHNAEVAFAGVEMNLVTKSGGNEFHGAAQYYREGFSQADNIDDELRAQGISRGSEIDYISDGSVQLGGPIARDKAWFFGSYRDWRVFRFVTGFPEAESTEMPVFLIKPTIQLDENHKVNLFYTRQTYFKPNRNASAFTPPESTWIEDDVFTVYQAQWQAILGQDAFLDARGSFLDVDFPLLFQPDVTGQSIFDVATGIRSRSASTQFGFRRKRWAADTSLSLFKSGDSGSHDVKLGAQYTLAPVSTLTERIDDVNLVANGNQALTATIFNSPNEQKQTVQTWSFYASDVWTIADRLTLSLGLRYDTSSAWLPEQGSLGGVFFPAQSFPKVDDVISGWGGFVPRISAIYQLPNDRTAVKASWGLYNNQLGTGFANFSNQNGTVGRTVVWNDLNGDLQFQPNEEGATLGTFGGNSNVIDPDLDSGTASEFTVGLEHELSNDWMVGATFVYRTEDDLVDQINAAIDFDRDFVPVTVDDVAGGPITVFNQVNNIGRNLNVLTNVADKETEYTGVEFIVRKRFSDNWQMQASLNLSDSSGLIGIGETDQSGTSNIFTSPNGRVNAEGNFTWDRPYVFKLSGSYLLPADVLIAGVLRSQSGAPLARGVTVGLDQGPVTVFVEPRGFDRLDSITTIDLRAGKEFDIQAGSRTTRLGLYADLFNLTNENTITSVGENNAAFLRPAGILGPRILRLGFRFTF